jgi:hypothetical protein
MWCGFTARRRQYLLGSNWLLVHGLQLANHLGVIPKILQKKCKNLKSESDIERDLYWDRMQAAQIRILLH